MINWHDIAFLGVGGFLLGSLAYTGWFTTHYEPEARPGYAVIGAGVATAVVANTWLQFHTRASYWFLVAECAAFLLVAVGLILIVRERRRR